MIGTEARLHQPLKLLCIDLGGGVISVRVMILKGLVDRLDVGGLSRCGRECSERQECKDRVKSDRLAAPSRSHDLTDDVVSRTRSKSSSSSATMGKSIRPACAGRSAMNTIKIAAQITAIKKTLSQARISKPPIASK